MLLHIITINILDSLYLDSGDAKGYVGYVGLESLVLLDIVGRVRGEGGVWKG